MVMDKIKMALGLDGAADAGEVLLAVVDLVQGCACAQAELARAQEEVLAAREATADVFVEALVELGFMDAEALEAARDAYVANPDAAAMALLGTVDFVQAANPWGCNQYGHRKGHRGGAAAGGKSAGRGERDAREEGKKADEDDGGEMPTQEEIDSFDELELKERKERMNAFQQEVAKTVRAHTLAKREYNAAYTRVHGRDKSVEVSQADRERLKAAEAKLQAARDAANEALRKRRRATRAAMKSGGQDDEYIERFVGRWPEKVKAANAAECLVSFEDLVEAACSVEELLLAEADAVLAANPDGCNQYGHRNGHQGKAIVLKRGGTGGDGRSGSGRKMWNLTHKKAVKDEAALRDENRRAGDVFSKAQEADRVAREKVFDLDQEREKALRAGETARVRQIDREMEEARRRAKSAREELERARKGYEDAYRGLLSERRKEKSGKGGE